MAEDWAWDVKDYRCKTKMGGMISLIFRGR